MGAAYHPAALLVSLPCVRAVHVMADWQHISVQSVFPKVAMFSGHGVPGRRTVTRGQGRQRRLGRPKASGDVAPELESNCSRSRTQRRVNATVPWELSSAISLYGLCVDCRPAGCHRRPPASQPAGRKVNWSISCSAAQAGLTKLQPIGYS